ncbi:low temperature requirement protein A [Micromonospora sp. NBC_01699]|uniref:low temperature requirement protein A n=1 Tax=Micromonospora sp. NBC_01699 TaxID=2975984 RepID=UPI002E2C7590|nr:low temperature requirement protein A [Micromonospora sp. NBC_01699]
MATDGSAEAATSAEEADRPAFLELFFDLVYVFALLSLAEKLTRQMTWAGAGQVLVLLLAFALIWALTAWAGSTVDLSRPMAQPQVIWTMAGSLLLAALVPDAYGSRGLLFAITYVLIHFGSVFYNLATARTRPAVDHSRRIILWESVAAIGWIGGGLATGTARAVLWAVAIAIEYAGVGFGWPVPRLDSSHHSRKRRLAGGRLSERYRKFVIIALGTSIFVAGQSFSETRTQPVDQGWALVVVFLITVLMWRIYIYRAGELMTVAISRSEDPSRLSQFTAVTHLIMVAGIVGTAAACQFVIAHPFDDAPPAWAATMLAGPGLFLLGRGLLDYIVFGRVSRSRPAGLVLLGAVAPVTHLLSMIETALLVMIILQVIAVANLLSTRSRPRAPAPPALG